MLANEKMIFLINKRVKKNKGRLISLSSLSSPDLPLFWSGSVVSIAPITINPSKAHLKKLFSRRFQNNRSYMVNPGGKQEIIPASSFNLDPDHLEPWKPVSSLNKFSQFVELDSAMMKPLLMDVHEKTPESLVLSFGIAEKYARYEKVMEFLMSRSEEFKERGFNTSYSISTFKEVKSNLIFSLLPYVLTFCVFSVIIFYFFHLKRISKAKSKIMIYALVIS